MKLLKISLSRKKKVTFLCRTHVILRYCQSGVRGFEDNISQSIINVIDIMLQDEDKDILSKEGFQDALVQNEVKAQFEMISLLKEKKLTSEFKHWLRK